LIGLKNLIGKNRMLSCRTMQAFEIF